ncbi:MAG: flagellar hook-associated 2 domain protein, partial [Acidimicrobiaceae bacterium]|nr:flagellar hook-associated 2 domain protein [Acidimicrobiaceae bacterium]
MSVSASSSSAPISFAGIESGLPTSSIIQAYLSLDEAPLQDLQNQQTTVGSQIAYYQAIQSQLTSLQTAADVLSSPNAFAADVSASSSNSAVATATTGFGAAPGSTTFSVNQLATADTLVSSGTVAAATDVVASGGSILIAAGGSALGVSSVSGAGLAPGAHTITVSQASSAATVTGTTSLTAGSGLTTITAGSNDQLSVSLDGQAHTYTIAAGTYSSSQLAAAVGAASGGTLSASVNTTGNLRLSTTEQGSAASLNVGSGSANASLGLSAGAGASGTDAVVSVDGTATTVSDLSGTAPTTLTLASGTGGSVTAVVSAGSGLSTGSITAQEVSVGDGSLNSVVSAINNAGLAMTAEALQVGPNAYALEVTSSSTGAANDVSIAPGAF